MLNVGIVGYGNVGKEVEIELKNSKNFNLIAIFDVKNAKNVKNYAKIIFLIILNTKTKYIIY